MSLNERLGGNNETLTEKYIKNSLLLVKQDLYNPLNRQRKVYFSVYMLQGLLNQ
jgi:hypothetical protein